MSEVKLTMTVERLPYTMETPFSQRDRLVARICVEGGTRGDDITLVSQNLETFDHADIASMLRVFAARIDRKYGQSQEVAA